MLGIAEPLLILGLYFLPSWFSWKTRVRWPLFFVNLLFAWALVGWLVAIDLALRARDHLRS